MKYQGNELLAKLTVYKFEGRGASAKNQIIAWLRREAEFLETKEDELSKIYTSRFLLNDKSGEIDNGR